MGPIIYTTYGVAMGQRLDVLAATGGLSPAGAGWPRALCVTQGLTRVGSWLAHLLIHRRQSHQEAASHLGDAATMRDIVMPNRSEISA